VTVTPAEPSERAVEIARYVIRRCRSYANVPPRQFLKKVLGAPAVVVNNGEIVSLLGEMRPELIDQSPAIVWHKNLLAEVR
jgi:hypothetical protein